MANTPACGHCGAELPTEDAACPRCSLEPAHVVDRKWLTVVRTLLSIGKWLAIATVLPVLLISTEDPPNSLAALLLLFFQWWGLTYFNKRLRGVSADLPGPVSVAPEDPHDEKVLLDLIAFAMIAGYSAVAWYYIVRAIFSRNEA
jgi:uncharacterized paraquat-inducible protein A